MDWLITSFPAILHNPDTYGHLFYATILTGTFLVSRRRKTGWLFRVAGDIGWVVVGYIIGMYSIVIWSSIFALNDFRGFLLWKWKEERKKLKKQRKKLNENIQLQGQRPRVAKVRGKSYPVHVRSARGRCSEPPNGFTRPGYYAFSESTTITTPVDRVQEHKAVSESSSPRPSVRKHKRKSSNTSSSVETPGKGVR